MEFTRKNWENAPEGARLELNSSPDVFITVTLVGYARSGRPVVEVNSGQFVVVSEGRLRIVLPKRKVTVQLWRDSYEEVVPVVNTESTVPSDWTLLGEHTFEIERE
ncbi:hypothetical protein CIW54_07500 [Paraburkholderia sp. T12-10]|nr:hypothetical protein CIW54_07500 [Paraburkholderia sp. T12-10]